MIIGVCGRVAAGKETLTEFLRKKDFVYLESSRLINEELEKRDMEITRKNQQDIADELRKKHGVGVLMQLFLSKMDKNKNYIIDSLRNSGEAIFMRMNAKDFVLIGVDAPQRVRFERIIKRGKPSDPKNWGDFLKMDERDNFDKENPMGQQTGKLLEMADFIVLNDGNLERSKKDIEEIWKKIEKIN